MDQNSKNRELTPHELYLLLQDESGHEPTITFMDGSKNGKSPFDGSTYHWWLRDEAGMTSSPDLDEAWEKLKKGLENHG